MKSKANLLLLMVPVLLSHTVLSADPNFRLQQGDVVTVDPETNRATVTRGGTTTPMWDRRLLRFPLGGAWRRKRPRPP